MRMLLRMFQLSYQINQEMEIDLYMFKEIIDRITLRLKMGLMRVSINLVKKHTLRVLHYLQQKWH